MINTDTKLLDLENKVDTLVEENDSLRDTISGLEDEVVRLENIISDYDETITSFKAETSDLIEAKEITYNNLLESKSRHLEDVSNLAELLLDKELGDISNPSIQDVFDNCFSVISSLSLMPSGAITYTTDEHQLNSFLHLCDNILSHYISSYIDFTNERAVTYPERNSVHPINSISQMGKITAYGIFQVIFYYHAIRYNLTYKDDVHIPHGMNKNLAAFAAKALKIYEIKGTLLMEICAKLVLRFSCNEDDIKLALKELTRGNNNADFLLLVGSPIKDNNGMTWLNDMSWNLALDDPKYIRPISKLLSKKTLKDVVLKRLPDEIINKINILKLKGEIRST